MRTLLALIALFLWTGISVNAQNCKYHSNKKDPFTGKEVKIIRIGFGLNKMLLFKKDGDSHQLTLAIRYSGVISDSARSSDTLLMKQTNGNIVKFCPTKSIAVPNNDGKFVSTVVNVEYAVSEAQLAELKKAPISDIRFSMAGGIVKTTFKVKGSKGEKMQTAAGCIQ